MLQLRPYQQRAVDMLSEHDSPCLVLPTGSGKTEVATQIALNANGPVVILVHAIQIVEQAAKRFRKYGLPCGVLAAGKRPRNETAVAASIQTVARMQTLPEAFLVIVDEAHRAAGPSYQSVIARYRKMGARVVGLTATPCRLDGTGLGTVGFDSLVEPVTYEELFDLGVLVRPEIYAPSVPNLKGVHIVAGELSGKEAASRIVGDPVKELEEKCPGGRALVFTCSIEHGISVAGQFSDAGHSVRALSGETPIEERNAEVDRLSARTRKALITCGLFGEGFDLPNLDCVEMLRPTMSLMLFRQQAGRVMRPAPGKTRAVILDHAGNTMRHGVPWSQIQWSLHGRTVTKRDAKKAKRCPQCFAVYAIGPLACPQCGFVAPVEARTVEHVQGELVRFQGVLPSVQEAVAIARDIAPGDSRAVAYVMMARKAWEKGYKPGWLIGAFRAKFGCEIPAGWGRMNDAVRAGNSGGHSDRDRVAQ